jgi:hypothetical protein
LLKRENFKEEENMKKGLIFLLTGIFVMGTLMVISYAGKDMKGKKDVKSDKMITEHVKQMAKDLNLSKDQEKKVLEAKKMKYQKMEEEKTKFEDAMKTIKDGFEKDLEAILNPEQIKKHKEMKEKGMKEECKMECCKDCKGCENCCCKAKNAECKDSNCCCKKMMKK